MSAFSLEIHQQSIAIVTIDVIGETMNTLRAEFADEISQVLEQVRTNPDIEGLVLISGKDNSFVAGADISMLNDCQQPEDARAIAQLGQQLFDQIAGLNMTVVAAINGPCLGGGLELALACDARVCSDKGHTVLGVPEVQLGLLPGSGGTQRLPKLVGIAKALDLMLTGKQLRPKQALKIGLVNEVVAKDILLATAIGLAKRTKASYNGHQPKLDIGAKLLENNPVGRNILFSQALKTVVKKTGGHYPAPIKIIECVKAGIEQGYQAGLDAESLAFSHLVMTDESKALRRLFFATTEMKKLYNGQGENEASPVQIKNVVVLGGGLMGGGIANVCATKAKVAVRIKDISDQGINQAYQYTYDLLNKKRKRRFITDSELESQMLNITATTRYSGMKNTDIVIEAVFEDLALKHQMISDIEQHCGEDTIFASNTSSLPITDIASVAKRPENVIGLHYFSPVDKMPLVEVIAHEKTSDQTIATTVAFARKQGKTPIVVKDGAGFYVNRILALYMNEAAQWLLEGQAIDKIDQALVKFGFPVGPITLLDEVGIDVGAKISPILTEQLGARFEAPSAFTALLNDGRKGKKNNKGFYLYGAKAKGKKQVDDSVYTLLNIDINATSRSDVSADDIAQRCVVQMLNEAVRCLEQSIISCPRDGDIGAIFGIGFPPFLAGPFSYIDKLGAANLVAMLEGYQEKHGERFAPCQHLLTMAEQQQTFY
ncbi:MAG: fatty acid oxidation complex subunit alpha FadJ [Gammaproteobacteria bacterium]|nr:fatty acid oxidation complex subunit alpha FadJ [Gammaproteobacteria bacterium]